MNFKKQRFLNWVEEVEKLGLTVKYGSNDGDGFIDIDTIEK